METYKNDKWQGTHIWWSERIAIDRGMVYVVWAVVFFVNRIRFLIIFKILLEFSRGQTMYYSFIMKISVPPIQGDYSEAPPPISAPMKGQF